MKPRNMFREAVFVASMAFVLLVFQGNASPGEQASTSYSIPVDVISSGGGDMSSTNYQCTSTLGQSSPLGTSQSSNYIEYAGFWESFWQPKITGNMTFLMLLLGNP
jgi:hypothetical protein